VEQIVFRLAFRDLRDGLVAALQGNARRGETALEARPHVRDLLAEIARDIAHLRDPVLIILYGTERAARGVAEIGPERGIRIGRHFVEPEFLVSNRVLDFGTIDVII